MVRTRHWHSNWFFYLLVGLVVIGPTSRATRVLEYTVFGVFLLYSAPWVVRRAMARRNGDRIPIQVTSVSGGGPWMAIGGGSAALPPIRAWCAYDYRGQHYSGVQVCGSVPMSEGTYEALVDPAHPDEPYVEKTPLLEMTLWPVLLAGLGVTFIWMAVHALIGP